MAFTFKLEHEDGTPRRPAHAAHGRTELAVRRHDPFRPGKDAPRH
jgi:hypothetical protein